ncbi:MAG: alpha/beta hydrolase [Prevotellaceae bacterium]|jgi:pimeloyl-ACP methyl ester carboxylesterase|nr:alpha/beta hydrolase [Prevotellaceae bacterium]
MNFENYKQLHFTNKNCDINYWYRQGTGNEVVFLLHGAGCDHVMFEKQLSVFDENYNVIAWDARGHGLSVLKEPQKFDFCDMIDDILKLFEIHKIKNAAFIGQSMGGNLAQEIAYRYPEKVSKMILIDSTKNTQELTIFEKIMLKMSKFIFKCYPYKTLINQSAAACGNTIYAQNYVKNCFKKLSKQTIIDITMSVMQCLHQDNDYRFPVPVLLLCGSGDKSGNIRKAVNLWQKTDENCELYMIQIAGHCANMDNPDETNKQIVEFLIKNKN